MVPVPSPLVAKYGPLQIEPMLQGGDEAGKAAAGVGPAETAPQWHDTGLHALAIHLDALAQGVRLGARTAEMLHCLGGQNGVVEGAELFLRVFE